MHPSGSRRAFSAFAAMLHAGIAIAMSTQYLGGANKSASTWEDWQKEGDRLLSAGRYPEALAAFRHALALTANAHVAQQDLLTLHVSFASAFCDDGQFTQAEYEFRQALKLEEVANGRHSLEYALLFANISLLPTRTGSREEGIQVLRTAIERGAQTDNSQRLAIARDYLAKALYSQGRIDEADQALAVYQASEPKTDAIDPSLAAELLNDLGAIRDNQRRFQDAVSFDQQAVHLIEENRSLSPCASPIPAMPASWRSLSCTPARSLEFGAFRRPFCRPKMASARSV